jgi:hypothetical protein
MRRTNRSDLRMADTDLLALAECCSGVRASIGRMLLATEGSAERGHAAETYRRSLRSLLRLARQEDAGLYLEVAGELASDD